MKIYCVGCDKYMGEIRDGKLRKEIYFLCENCNLKRMASDMKNKGGNNYKNYYEDLLKGYFGGK